MAEAHLGRYYAAAWIIFLAVWAVGAAVTKKTERTQSKSSRIGETVSIWIGAVLLIRSRWGIAALSARFLPRHPSIAFAGLAFTIAGLLFAIWARVHLGRNWSSLVTIKQNHELIRSGPYRAVRHPIYTGLLAAIAGSAAGSGEVHALIGAAFIAAGIIHKTKVEEQFLAEQFGDRYAQYRQEAKGLIPYVW